MSCPGTSAKRVFAQVARASTFSFTGVVRKDVDGGTGPAMTITELTSLVLTKPLS
jgi:hypothetical protein